MLYEVITHRGEAFAQVDPKIDRQDRNDNLIEVNIICPTGKQFQVPDLDNPGREVFDRFAPAHEKGVFALHMTQISKKTNLFPSKWSIRLRNNFV